MKCPICKKNMKLIEDVIKEDGIPFQAYKCLSCGEELMNMAQLKQLAMRYRKLRAAKSVTLAKWGNSLAVRIPKAYAALFKLKEGTDAMIIKEKDGLKIIPG